MARSSLAAALLRAIQPIRGIPQRARLSHKACRWHTQRIIFPAATDNATPTAGDPGENPPPGVTAMKLFDYRLYHYQSYCLQRSGLFAVSPSLLLSVYQKRRGISIHCHSERSAHRSLSFRAKRSVVEKSCRHPMLRRQKISPLASLGRNDRRRNLGRNDKRRNTASLCSVRHTARHSSTRLCIVFLCCVFRSAERMNMVAIAQSVEHLIVVQKVARSSRVSHPQ